MVIDFDLIQWQKRLEIHFRELLSRRVRATPSRPIFGLEHGLDLSEVLALETSIRKNIASRFPSQDHILPWIVYAAEIGYGYSGDEYWQTFEEKTPGWLTYGSREWIRECFHSFQKEFNGAVPSGPWAEQFTIICWPITHAILPKDLQRQLAHILYDLRHSITADILESPSALGKLISLSSYSATSRFQNLAQETELVGQIAAALLLEEEAETEKLIYPKTLRRIGEDLEHERQAREWLLTARKVTMMRTQVHGIGLLGLDIKPSEINSIEEAREEVAVLGIEPRLILRPVDPSNYSWQIFLEIPDLSHLPLRFPQSRDILANSRCVVAGASGRPLARGWLLFGTRRVILIRWPREDEVLLKFEQTDKQLDYLLRTECLLRPGSKRLFRIASDNIAYECRSLRVRPEERYIVVSTSGPIPTDEHITPVSISCEGIYGSIINLPQAFDIGWQETIHRLGLEQSNNIEVWPAGLAAVFWDGEGHGEWLGSEHPCLAISTDHPITSILISVDDDINPPLELTPIVPGEPIFVELPQLPIGSHLIHISQIGKEAKEAELLGDLNLVMRIRKEHPWSSGVNLNGPLLVEMEPLTPTLEEIWEGRVDISIKGPSGYQIKCDAALFRRDGESELFRTSFSLLDLPLSADTWRHQFEKNFKNIKRTRNAYETARLCELKFSAGELGYFIIRCDREFAPLRWILLRNGQEYSISLSDDTECIAEPELLYIAFETPCVEKILEPEREYRVPNVGGMYVARVAGNVAATIAPPNGNKIGLSNISCHPRVDKLEDSIESVNRLVELVCLWGRARLPGDLISELHRHEVMLLLVHELIHLFCGEDWEKAENKFNQSTGGDEIIILSRAVSRSQQNSEIGIVLYGAIQKGEANTITDCINLLVLVLARYHLSTIDPLRVIKDINREDSKSKLDRIESYKWIAEFSLRLASNPISLEKFAGQYMQNALRFLKQMPTFTRAARFLVIASDRTRESRFASDELFAGWRWI
jgi:hypothetical protein